MNLLQDLMALFIILGFFLFLYMRWRRQTLTATIKEIVEAIK